MASTTSPAFSPPASPVKREEDFERLLIKSARLSVQIRKKYASIKPCIDSKYFTYTLLLQEGRIYVGNSDNIYTRLMEHYGQSSQSSQFVREYGPVVRVLEIIRNSPQDAERYKTLEWCDLIGAEKVRGAGYCRVESRGPPPPLASFRRDPHRPFDYLSRQEIDDVVRIAKDLGKELFN